MIFLVPVVDVGTGCSEYCFSFLYSVVVPVSVSVDDCPSGLNMRSCKLESDIVVGEIAIKIDWSFSLVYEEGLLVVWIVVKA